MSARSSLRVRLAARVPGLVRRYRAGMVFGLDMRTVEVDAAQALAIRTDPLLQVETVETQEATESAFEPVLSEPATRVSLRAKKSKVNASEPVHAGSQAGGDV